MEFKCSCDYKNVIPNEYFWLTSKIFVSLSKLVNNRSGYFEGCNEYDLYTNDEKRIANLSKKIKGLRNSIETIENSSLYMQDYNLLRDVLFKRNILEDEFINYHFDVFCHRVSTLHDIYFKLINVLYGLNIKERECDWTHINVDANRNLNRMLTEN